MGAAIGTGTVLEYLATVTTSSSSLAGSSASSDHGLFKLTLGSQRQVGGVSGYEVVVSGKTKVGGHEFLPPWTFVAQVGARWLGSIDGNRLVTLYDPAMPAGTSGFFLRAPSARLLSAKPGRFAGDYNAYSGVAVTDVSAEGGCQWVLTLTLCSDSSTEFAQQEVLIDGIGPVAFSERTAYSVGGSAPQVVRRTLALELVRTSLAARDGTVVRGLPWQPGVPMPIARSGARALVSGGHLYLFGGTGSEPGFDGRRVDVFDLRTRTWSRAPDAPRSLAGWHGTGLGTGIALFGGSDGLLFDPATGRWAATARLLAPGSITAVGTRTRSDGQTEVVAILDPGASFLQATLARYVPGTNSWQSLGTFDRGQRGNYEAVLVGDSFYLIGGFANGAYLKPITVVNLSTRGVRQLAGSLIEGVTQPALIEHGGIITVAGGHNFGGARRSVQVINTLTGAVSSGPALLGGLREAAGAWAEGKVLLLGGRPGGEGSQASTEVWMLGS